MSKKDVNVCEGLHIVFHNPNSPEGTARYLIKTMAACLAEKSPHSAMYETSDRQQAVQKIRNADTGTDPARRK